MVYLDVETTGLRDDDEVLEIALVAKDGTVLLDTLVRPVRTTEWKRAAKINGITPEMVFNSPTLDELAGKINKLIEGQHVRIYNAKFDSRYIDLSTAEEVSCVMEDFSEFYGVKHEYYGGYSWHKLTDAAEYLRIDSLGGAHRALADAELTRRVDAAMSLYVDSSYVDGGKRLAHERKVEREIERIWLEHDANNKSARFVSHGQDELFLSKLGVKILPSRAVNSEMISDEYAQLFFGKTVAEIERGDYIDSLKLEYGDFFYTKRSQVASGLISKTAALAMCDNSMEIWWIVSPRADAVIVSPKTIRYLYNEDTLKKLIDESRAAQLFLNPRGHTRTELRQMGFKDEEIDEQEVTGYGRGNYGSVWGLYPIPVRK